MNRAEYLCPACNSVVPAPVSLAGHAAPCPKCGEYVASWPFPLGLPPAQPSAASPAPAPHYAPQPSPSVPPPLEDATPRLLSVIAWLGVAVLALAVFWGVALTLVHGRDRQRELRDAIAAAEQSAAWGFSAYGFNSANRLDKALLESALEKDQVERPQAVANIAFAGLFVCASLGTAAVFLPRPPSLYRTAVLWGAIAATGAGLLGATLSQFAPLWHGLARGDAFTPYQLGYLAGHTFLCGLIGAAFGAGAGVLRARSPQA